MRAYEGKKVVITGGTTGFALTTAKLLVDHGARVLVTGRKQPTIDAARAELGPHALVVQSDAASFADIEMLADRVKTEFKTFDLLYVNSTRYVPFESVTGALYDEVFGVNAKGASLVVQKLAPLVTAGGAVVFTTSVATEKRLPISAYSLTKVAIRSMVRTLAAELLPHGIRVNSVSPGPNTTQLREKSMPRETLRRVMAELIEENPMKRLGRPEEIAKAVLFLGFDATYTTGAELPVDGGYSSLW